MFISLCSLCSWIRANDDNLPDVIVLQRFFMRFILLNDRSHLTAVGGMVKRTPMIVKMPGCKSLYVCCSVSWSLETLMSAILHLTLHLAIFDLNVSYVWGRSGAKAAYIVGSILSRWSVSLEGNKCYTQYRSSLPRMWLSISWTKWSGRNYSDRTPFGHQC